MKTLILMRHAKSSWGDAGLRDAQRPLNKRGQRDAPVMGKRLAARVLPIDLLVSSPALRARTTAGIVAESLDMDADRIVQNPSIYEADTDDLLAVVRSLPEQAACPVLIGHNPGFTDFSNHLAATGIANIPTCGIVILSLPVEKWSDTTPGRGSLVDFDYPKKPGA